MTIQDSVFALSTLMGKSGVAVIRITGPDSLEALHNLGYKKNPIPRQATYTVLISPTTQEVLDEGIIIYFQGPCSFTGEDSLELHLHGSIAVIRDVMEELGKLSFLRLAEPGEFTKRAFENGKMDLTKVEALSDLIDSETSIQRRIALQQLSGELKSLYDTWRQELIHTMAQLEAYIDFPEDDIPKAVLQSAESRVQKLTQQIQHHLDVSTISNSLMEGIKIAIGGAPNAGKSSLLNLIAKQDVAIVSDLAGTTRDVIQVKLNLDGFSVILADTAGIRESTNVIEQEGVNRAKLALRSADINLIMLDLNEYDESFNFKTTMESILCEVQAEHHKENIFLLNKCDLLDLSPVGANPKITSITKYLISLGIKQERIILFSTQSRYNLHNLLQLLSQVIKGKYCVTTEPIITNIRQKQRLAECINNLRMFSMDKPLELAAQDIRFAAKALEVITGRIELDEVLNEIFSNFCIGK
ncbi:tRNA modification GTPase MnmE [Alphaproteobacteria bacterium]